MTLLGIEHLLIMTVALAMAMASVADFFVVVFFFVFVHGEFIAIPVVTMIESNTVMFVCTDPNESSVLWNFACRIHRREQRVRRHGGNG